jgi:ribosomal protein S6
MRNYNASLIFSPLLQEQQVNDILQQLASFVQDKGGILGTQDIRGKRPLLAPIHNVQEGYLATLSFTLLPEHLEGFEKTSGEQKEILRFLIAKQAKKRKTKKQTLAPSPQPISLPQTPEAEPIASKVSETLKEEKEEKVDLKDIDEKLEEIFKETP